MALLTYVTNECRRECARHSLNPAMENFISRVETSQDTRHFDPFPYPYLVKKQFGGRQGRLIAIKLNSTLNGDNHLVIVFLSVMMRGDRNYDAEFSQDPIGYGDRILNCRYTEDEIKAYVKERLTQQPVQPKISPSEEEYGYLYEALDGSLDDNDEIICESAEWCATIQKEPFKDSLVRLYDALTGVDSADYCQDLGLIKIANKTEWSVLARYYPQYKTWFLAGIVIGANSLEEAKIRQKYASIILVEAPEREDILRCCRRAYPAILLADDSLWLKMQKDPLGNLALSPEETSILESSNRKTGAFPLFINGRAGSGKSTILQYLFTDYMFYHLREQRKVSSPIYFACNAELVTKAKSVVESLLSCGAKYWEYNNRAVIEERGKELLGQSFKEFRSYLLSLVPREEKKKFLPRNRIDYARFRKLWLKKFEPDRSMTKECSPDLCWHVIRTFIKGACAETFLEPDEYAQLAENQKSVSQQMFEKIFYTVWQKWLSPLYESEHLWDDQDLSRFLLEKELIPSVYPAIFCDEAQDFTRIELEVILRLSLFSNRTVKPSDIAHIPFVFAGDQFQTLNPTGFRWDSVKAFFVEKFIFALDPSRHSGLNDMNYRELSYNYRSSRQIVGLSNNVQALRSLLFSHQGIQPQQAWAECLASPIISFNSSDPSFWETIANAGDVIFIIPCHEDEEIEFIQNDPYLSKHIPISEGVPSLPVFSSARAKGLEFQRVVVYGFGDESAANLLESLKKDEMRDFTREALLPHEYFINRLYVAVSRPKMQLIIVDSPEGRKKLWEFATNLELQSLLLKRLRNGESIWKNHLTLIESGRKEHLNNSDPVDLISNAKQLEADGNARCDSFMLRQAAVAYKNCGDEHKALLCSANAAYIDENYVPAGDLLAQCGEFERAINSYWLAGKAGWAKILVVAKEYLATSSTIEYAFAEIIHNTKTFAASVKVIKKAQKILETKPDLIFDNAPAFSLAIETVLSMGIKNWSDVDWRQIYLPVSAFYSNGLSLPHSLMATLAFRAGDFELAKNLWVKIGETSSVEYRRALAETEPYPVCLLPLGELNDWRRILLELDRHKGLALGPTDESVVSRAFCELDLFEEAVDHLLRTRDKEVFKYAAKIAERKHKEKFSNKFNAVFLALSVEAQDWGAVEKSIDIKSHLANEVAIGLARGLARSEALPMLPVDSKGRGLAQKSVSSFLREKFISPGFGVVPANLVFEIGAAVERAGNSLDSLLYYEMVQKASGDARVVDEAVIRWIVCKERRANYESQKGNERVAREHKRNAEEARDKIGIALDQLLPEYPELGDFRELIAEICRAKGDPVTDLEQNEVDIGIGENKNQKSLRGSGKPRLGRTIQDVVKMQVEHFKIAFYPRKRRINIENSQTGETLSIIEGGEKITGDWEVSEPDDNGFINVEEPELTILIKKSGPARDITLNFRAQAKELFFPILAE